MDNSAAQCNSAWDSVGGRSTLDKVFLLSYAEVQKYFSTDSERECEATAWAKAQGAYYVNGNGWWWLRSPGSFELDGTDVAPDGSLGGINYISDDTDMVRPALWIDLSSGSFEQYH